MISAETDRWAHLGLPIFWSTQFENEIKSFGVPTFADEVVVTQGSVSERRFIAVYGRRGRITAAVAFNQGRWLEFYQDLIYGRAPFPPSFRTFDQPAERRPLPAEIPDVPPGDATAIVTGHDPSERRATLVRRRR
jgi:hypothetical protein